MGVRNKSVVVSGCDVATGDDYDDAVQQLDDSNVLPFPSRIQTPPTMLDTRDE